MLIVFVVVLQIQDMLMSKAIWPLRQCRDSGVVKDNKGRNPISIQEIKAGDVLFESGRVKTLTYDSFPVHFRLLVRDTPELRPGA
jgi:hypothetical protein